MKKIKIAQIGIGHNHGEAKMLACRKFPDIFEVVGYAESDEEWIKKRAALDAYKGLRRYNEEEILSMDDIDAVLVETDVWRLNEIAKKCVDRGLHVHIDKPAGENLEEYAQVLRTAKEKKLIVQLAYMYRQNPAIEKTMELIRSGKLGEVLYIDTMMSTDHDATYRKWLEHFAGGTMYIFGCHLIDIVYSIMGKPQEVIPHLHKSGLGGADSYDNDIALLRYPTGITSIRTSSVEVNGFGRRQLVICGTKGTVEIKPLERPTKMYVSYKEKIDNIYSDTRQEVICDQVGGDKRYDKMMLDFASFIRKEKENPYTYEYELELQKVILSASGVPFDENLIL